MRKLLAIFALLFPAFAYGQYTAVSAHIVDSNGGVYQNCSLNAVFVGQSSDPGPYLISGSVFSQSIDGAKCDSSGNITVRAATNSAVSPTPSQWQFNFCDQTGKYCGQTLITISGSTQDISSALTAVAPILPSTGIAGYNRIQDEGSNLTQRNIINFIGSPILCVDNSGSSRTDCTITAGAAYSTVQDEGTPLTQRSTINFTGAGIACSDSGGITVCNVAGGGGGVTGSGTNTHMMSWGPSNTAIDTNLIVGTGTLAPVSGSFQLNTATSGVGSSPGIVLTPGSSTAGAGFSSGGVSLSTASNTTGGDTGSVLLSTGNATTTGTGAAGIIQLEAGTSLGQGGNIVFDPGHGATTDGILSCGNPLFGQTPGCAFVLYKPGGAASAGLVSGSGVPSGNCQVPLVRPQVSSMPVLYLRTDPASASTFLYICIPPNTWTAVTP